MIRRPPVSILSDTPFPYTTLCRAVGSNSQVKGEVRDSKNGKRMASTARPSKPEPIGSSERRITPLRLDRGCSGLPAKAIKGRGNQSRPRRSEEHTSELQSLMRISYAVFCLKKQITDTKNKRT